MTVLIKIKELFAFQIHILQYFDLTFGHIYRIKPVSENIEIWPSIEQIGLKFALCVKAHQTVIFHPIFHLSKLETC